MTGKTRADSSAAAPSILASPGAVAEIVSSTLPSSVSRMRTEIVTALALPSEIVPSMISRARSGTAILGPTTTTATLPATSARAISLATGWP
jgi:hypothetical protein